MSVRVYQLAKQLGIDNKRMIQLLRERGLDVRSPSNSIPTIYADALIEEVGDKKLILENDQKEENTESLESAESAVIINPAQDNEQKDKEIDTEIKEAEPKTEGKQHHDEEIVKSDVAETFEGKAPKAETTKIKTNSGDFIDLSKNIQLYKGRKSTSTRNSGIITLKKHEKKLTAPTENAEESKTDEKRPIITKDRNYSKRVPFQSSYNLNFKKKRDDRSVKFPERSSRYGQKEVYDGERRVLPPNIKPFLKKIELQVHNVDLKPIEVRPPIIVRALAAQIDVKPFQLISKLMSMNVFASMNQELDIATAQKVAEKFGYSLVFAKEPIKVKKQQTHKKVHDLEKSDETLVERAPVVCVLGHVDHGKTTLLDTIRSTKVAAGEAGGITQHVAAYQVERNGKKITFIDTPGHAAFSKMRERGANMTDIGVLVVAADDGFMPQTDEALKFAQNAGIPVVVAINKIDAKGANVDRVKQQMQQRGITPEEWGGETLCAEISALNNTNVDTLLELILLQAEMLELKASPNASPEGIVLESKIATGQGPTASVIVQEGTLKVGDYLVCGRYYCKVKSIIDDHGKQIKSAATSSPVSVTGWGEEVKWNTCQTASSDVKQFQIAFIVDATGSMSDEIDFLKADLTNIITTVRTRHDGADIRTAALFYRDEGDDYLTRVSDFTSSLPETVSFIREQNADGGGDYPEAVHTALETGLQKLSWQEEGAVRLAFMLLDAPPHKRADVIASLQQSIPMYAKLGIRIIPVAASGVDKPTEFFLRFASIATDGTYVFITNHSGIGNDHMEATVGDYQVELLNELIIRLIDRYMQ